MKPQSGILDTYRTMTSESRARVDAAPLRQACSAVRPVRGNDQRGEVRIFGDPLGEKRADA